MTIRKNYGPDAIQYMSEKSGIDRQFIIAMLESVGQYDVSRCFLTKRENRICYRNGNSYQMFRIQFAKNRLRFERREDYWRHTGSGPSKMTGVIYAYDFWIRDNLMLGHSVDVEKGRCVDEIENGVLDADAPDLIVFRLSEPQKVAA